MKKRYLAMLIFIPVLFLAACGAQSGASESGTDAPEQTVSESETSSEAEEAETDAPASSEPEQIQYNSLAQSVNALGYHLFSELTQSETENLCFSPYSIEAVLGMAAEGAEGATLEEIERVMQTDDLDAFTSDFSVSRQKLESDAMDIRIANSVWYQKNLSYAGNFETDYLPTLKNDYAADCYPEDLSDASLIQTMNDWIADATNQKITNLVSEVPDDAVMLLFNAVYFNAEWAIPFPKESTYAETFYGSAGEQQVSFMHMSDQYFKYYEYKGIRMLRMRYKDSDMAMDILIPADETADVTALYNALSDEEKQELYDGLSDAEEISIAALALPRFTFESDSMPLNEYLADLGMSKAFTGAAEFSKISDEVCISDIIHKTYIRVDENGTEAAAVTEAIMNLTALPAGDPVTFEVTMPFMYYISDTSDDTILFMGRMNQIEKS